ncbi:MAG: carbohydrate-binding protein [Mucilaginibacter sp.]|nr:carbohydrate-binding protein [Mucilaginibacter sp.]
MSAHPQLTKDDASEIVKYILTLNDKKVAVSLPREGNVALKDHLASADAGRYILTASYTDKGGAITPLTTTESLVLRPAKVYANSADKYEKVPKINAVVTLEQDQAYFVFKDIDLKNVGQLTYSYSSRNAAKIEVHTDSPTGAVISTFNIKGNGNDNTIQESTVITDPQGKHDLYFVFTKTLGNRRGWVNLGWINFDQQK